MERTMRAAFGVLALAACGSGEEAAEPAEKTGAAADIPWIVAAANPYAVEAGAGILEAGGSAVDAAVAVQAVLGLVEPQSSGLGGGAFMLYYDASGGELIAYDGREMAPASAHAEVFLREDGTPMGFYEAVTSGFSVGVPGTVAMLDLAHTEHSRLDWPALFAPAESLAREGFDMPGRLHESLGRFVEVRKDPQAAIYLSENGEVLAQGTRIRNEAYAETVAMIASRGAGAFYTGDIAEAIVERVNRRTGETTLTLDDFAGYEAIRREPVCALVAQHRLCSMPPPSSGGITALQIAQMFEILAPGMAPEDALLAYIEASRLAYADRNHYIGDPTAMGTDGLAGEDLTERLVSTVYLEKRADMVGDAPAASVKPGDPEGAILREGRTSGDAYEVPSTTHFSIRDSRGNIVSMTSSVEFGFGSQMMAGGMVLNNQLTDFSRIPGSDNAPVANAPGPGKRPMSSMTPMIVFEPDGDPYAALGSPGGSAIIGYVIKPLLDHLMTGQPLSAAILEPHVVAPRGTVLVEAGAEDLAEEVRSVGYEVTLRELSSGLYGFALSNGGIEPVVDPRREGAAQVEGR